nr:RHS repeat-associated core domain-containing protein [Planomonospora parontospora]
MSLTYDASSVDGQGDWTNNQSGAVGVGWELNTGFIERKYRRCTVDNYYDWETAELTWYAEELGTAGRAVCWESPDENDGDAATNDYTQSDLVLNVGGRSASIVKDRTSGAWKTVPDFGWRIEQVSGGADGQPYWRVTSSEGQVYRFGYTKDAQWQLPYIANQRGEPCWERYFTDADPPTCTGVWRWNLDQELDRNENVVDYVYERETNYFCLPSCYHETYRVMPYDRGGVLKSVQWGHNTQVAGSTPTARMSFTTADRGGVDVPGDLLCTAAQGCANDALAFYSTRKLTSVLTETLNTASAAWEPVTRLDLRHEWVYTRTDFGAPYDPVLWLDTVQQTGLAGTPAKLPPTDFDAAMVAGKMVYDDMSDWTDFLSWRMVPRIAGIGNGLGGRIEVAYGQADPCSGGKGRDGSDYFADQSGDCYRVDMYDGGNEAWTRYFKQLAMKVTERDLVGGSPDIVHGYEYSDGPRWTNPVEYAEPQWKPPTSDWRGYGTVHTTRGSGSDPNGYTVTSQTFFRGTGAPITDFEGNTVTDALPLQGQVLQEQAWKLTSLSPRTYAEMESTRYEYAVVSTGTGPGVQDPAFVHRTKERTREQVSGGGWRWSEQRTAYNADGLPVRLNDYGDTSTAADNTCTTTTYARNTASGQWLTGLPSVVERRAGDDCAAGQVLGRTVALYDGGSDPATNAPSDGNVTETRTYADASTASVTKSTFDDYGRLLTSTDPLGKTTTTAYSPATGWPRTGVTVTNPLGHTSTVVSSHRTGLPVVLTDANGKRIEIDYDALGRTTALWRPGEPRSGGTPTVTVSYDIPFDGNLGQPTGPARTTMRRLLSGTGADATYTSTFSYDDGLGRTRETQTASPAGGRAVTVTAYDGRGLAAAASAPVHNTGEPGSGLLNPALASLPQWTKTVYDGLERPTAVIDHHLGDELRRTTTAYPGADRMEVTPPVGGKTVTISNVADRTTKVEEWKDASTHHDTTYGYDRLGNLTKITDANGGVRTFTYDWLGRRTAGTDPDSGSTTAGYDAAGRLAWSVDGNGTKVSLVYDVLGRPTSQWTGEASTGTKLAEWTYDTVAKGQLTSSVRYVGGHAYTDAVTAYDHAYRPTGTKLTIPAAESDLAGEYVFTAAYDRAGNMTGQGMPAAGDLAAEQLTFSYTGLGLPQALTSDFGGGTTYVKEMSYSKTARPAERSYGASGQVKRAFTWDEATGWLERLTTTAKADTSSPAVAQDDRVTYNAAGQITRILDAAAATDGSPGQSECFAYDGLDRLTAAFTTTGSSCEAGADNRGPDPYDQRFAYDAVGNLTSLTDGGTTATYAYPTGTARPNAVTSITRPGRTDTYGYDDAGRLTSRTVDGKQAVFTWNPLGQLDKAVIDGAETSMVYDADGERLIRRDPDGSRTLYLGGMEVKSAGGQVKATRYYTGPDGSTVAMRDASGIKWLASGLHGSAQLAIDDSTGQVSRERYLPYGQRRGIDDLPFTDRGFLGKTEDASTGLTYLSARYYDPATARFISPDPLLSLDKPQWTNPYSYAVGDPIGMSDPTGLRPPPKEPKSACGPGKDHTVACKAVKKRLAETLAKNAEADVNRYLQELIAVGKQLGKLLMDALGVTNAVNCFTTGDANACTDAAIDALASLVGGAVGKLAAKYGAPWKWHKLKKLVDDLWNLGGRAFKALDGLLDARKVLGKRRQELTQSKADLAKSCGLAKKATSSFVPGTPVVMADGSRKPIEQVKIGDTVLASDPKSGKVEAKPVIALITSKGDKHLVRLTVDTDGVKGESIGVVVATANHRFWLPELREWRTAGGLRPGNRLRTSASVQIQVIAVTDQVTIDQRVHNLTIDDLHTYYIAVGTHDALVHNEDPCGEVPFGPKLNYEANPKHANGKLGSKVGPEPTNAKAMLARSLNISERRRIAYDAATGEIIVFARTEGATWHGYVVTWSLLDQKSKNAFIRAGIFNKRGKAR